MIDATTLTGLTLDQAANHLDRELPKSAYKAVPGATDLTDIDPNYMRDELNAVFGVCGFGWGYNYEARDLETEVVNKPRKDGSNRIVYQSTLSRLDFWYKLVVGGQVQHCSLAASGGSENDVINYAMKGAITNALGNAASNVGFQKSVYMGKRDHHNVGKTAATQTAATIQQKPAAPVAKPAAQPASKAAPVPTPADIEDLDAPAGAPVIVGTLSKSWAGKKFSEVPESVVLSWTNIVDGGDAAKVAFKQEAIAYLTSIGKMPASTAA